MMESTSNLSETPNIQYGVALEEIVATLPAAYQVEINKFKSVVRSPLRYTSIQKYFAQKQASPATKTIAKYALKKVLKLHLIETNQISKLNDLDAIFKQIKTGKPRNRVSAQDIITKEEMSRIRKCRDKRVAILCEILNQTGLRINELASIRLKDCYEQPSYMRIKILGKGSKERNILLGRKLFNEARKAFQGHRFLIEGRSGRSMTTRHIRRIVCSAGKVLKRRIFPHLFRHTFATNTIARTGKIKGVSEYLGHSNPAITLKMYVHEQLQLQDLEIA